MVRRCSDERQSQSDVHPGLKSRHLERNEPLVVVHGDHHDFRLTQGPAKYGVGRERPFDVQPGCPGPSDRGPDLLLLRAHESFLSGVGIQPGHEKMEAPRRPAKEGPIERQEKGFENLCLDPGQRFPKGHMMAEQGDLERLGPEGHDRLGAGPGEVLGVSAPGEAGQAPGLLGNRGRDHGLERPLRRLIHRRGEILERSPAALCRKPPLGRMPRRKIHAANVETRPGTGFGRGPGLRENPETEGALLVLEDALRAE
ncbi:MAG: hypothetical protein A2Y86_09625 [Candidatus Aminicenantes bacterium RBG_13_62_12]|nr:MAG: hypothetical protein A2Y86_09625 [Candidatus Aminicenantes bacterium RBG_13_62_12]